MQEIKRSDPLKLLVILLTVALVGCTESIVLSVDKTLAHEEIVGRLKKLLKEEFILAYGTAFLMGGSEERVSPTVTRLTYSHSTPLPSTSLYTPNISHDWTSIYINTSRQGEVKISVKTYRRGDFINSRQREAESRILKNLSILKERANKLLRSSARSGG